ncbi:hypothetical protein D9M71_535830 [compost metagenome]
MRGVPRLGRRIVAQTDAVVVADLGDTFATVGPVAARVVGAIGECRAVGLRAGQHVVHVGLVAAALDLLPVLIQSGLLVQVVLAVQLREILGDDHALGVLPRPVADAITGVHRGGSAGSTGAQIGTPGVLARTAGSAQFLAELVGAGQAAKVGALARAMAGDEEGHIGLAGETAGQRQQGRRYGEGESRLAHGSPPAGNTPRWNA